MSLSTTAPATVRATSKRLQAVQLRIGGATYREIADQIGVTRQRAFQYVKQALVVAARKTGLEAEALLELEQERLNQLQAALWPAALKGDPKAATAVLRVMDMRAKLLNLYPARTPTDGAGPLDGMTEAELLTEARRHGLIYEADAPSAPALPHATAAPAGLPFRDTSGFPGR